MMQWMIYGATGYTGKIIAEQAAKDGLKPVLAGRDLTKVKALADRLGLPSRAFDLSNIGNGLEGIGLVLHCAGPFSQTSSQMVEACLKAKAHYLDITGEIDVLEAVYARDAEAKAAKVTLLPGAGFDVVPSDCLAMTLKNRMPNAVELSLAFCPVGKTSPGTLKTSVESLPRGSRLRRDGKWKTIPIGSLTRKVPFSHRTFDVSAIPWGDLSSAYRSTGIPNITTYISTPPSLQKTYAIARRLAWLAKLPGVQTGLKKIIEAKVPGPTAEERAKGRVYLWGEVRGPKGETVSATAEVPEGYRFTVMTALTCVARILKGDVAAGALTPAQAFGAEFLKTFPETTLTIL